MLDSEGDIWGGAGPALSIGVAGRRRLDASLMAGFYARGSGADLGGSTLFRSQIEISHPVPDRMRGSVSFSRMSTCGHEDRNPGQDSAVLFLSLSF